MASNSVNTGAAGSLYIEANVVGTEAWNNRSLVAWAFYLNERVSSPTTWSGGGIGASTTTPGFPLWSGSFGFDWRPAGLQSTLIASGTYWAPHNPDGTGATIVAGAIDATGTSGAGGPSSVDVYLPLPTLKVLPGTPTGVSATRVNDTQVTVSWSQSSASNGQPTSNIIQRRINGGAWTDVVTIAPSTSATVSAAANQKLEYRVAAANTAGQTAWSSASTPIYTTPAAPSGVSAAKNASLDIVVNFTENVAYSEYEHEVWHGTVSGGVTTWDGSRSALLGSGVKSWTHTNPNPGQVHVYRVRARAGSLLSSYATSNNVQLLTAPNAPTLPALPAYRDKAAEFVLSWTHNPVDSTAQKYYEVEYSTDGGTSWTSTGKVTSTISSRSFAASTWAADVTVTFRVRTWGQATTGGSDGTGASPWSATRSSTFKTRPVGSIVAPANGSVLNESTLAVTLGFSQAEGASFVDATITLKQGAEVLETMQTTSLVGTVMDTRVENAGAYTLEATVRDSNGLVSTVVTSSFTVDYLDPVPAGVTVIYLEESGFAQLDLAIPAPGAGQAEAVQVRITRTILGVTETVLAPYPAAAEMTILDTTPTVNGTNTYVVTTISADGSELNVTEVLLTAEPMRAYLSKGPGLAEVVAFGGNLRVEATPTVASALVAASGRSRPIGLYATTGTLTVSGTSTLVAEFGSTAEEIEALLLMPGRACYRDPSGRRVIGLLEGSISRQNARIGELSFTISETS